MYEDAYSWRVAGWKLLATHDGAPPILYNLDQSPAENHDLAGERRLERRFMTDSLATFLAYETKWKKSRWGVATNVSPQFAEDLER